MKYITSNFAKNLKYFGFRGFFTSIYFTLEKCFKYQNRLELDQGSKTSSLRDDNGPTSKIDDVLIEHCGLHHVLLFIVDLFFFCRGDQSKKYSLSNVVGPLVPD